MTRTQLVAPALLCGLLVVPVASAQTVSPPWQGNIEDTGTPGLSNAPLFLWYSGTFTSAPTLRIDRHVGNGSGESWNTYKGLWVLGSGNASNAGFEWTITGEQHNTALASTGAQNVAVNGTIFKETPPGGGSVGPSWGGNFNCTDTTGEVNPVASCIGAEIDVGAKAGAGTDANRQRVGVQIVGGGADDVHTGYGILMGTNGGTFDRGITLAGPYGIGIDFTSGSFSGAAIMLGPEQWLALDGKVDGSFGHFIGMHAGLLTFMSPYGPLLRFADDGAAYVGRLIEAIPHAPASSSSPCEPGEHAWDQSFEYRCVAPNRWKRVALNDF